MLSTAKSLLALENKEKLGYLSVLVTQLRNKYSSWIRGVQRFNKTCDYDMKKFKRFLKKSTKCRDGWMDGGTG